MQVYGYTETLIIKHVQIRENKSSENMIYCISKTIKFNINQLKKIKNYGARLKGTNQISLHFYDICRAYKKNVNLIVLTSTL
jgi:hypothetical protein